VDEDLNRSDVRSDPSTGTLRDGAPLLLTFNVSQVQNGSCAPLAGAKVEIWHCDAAGQYSDVTDRSFSTKGQQWLRGYQMTDASGKAIFTTIYPGWYPGRAVHIHFKVHPDTSSVFTSQLFFDDTLSDVVLAKTPYVAGAQQRTLNSTDGIYKQELLLAVTPSGDGYTGTFDIGVEG
jgi:protocatechuate 3,4-dioxygenase beta subunit